MKIRHQQTTNSNGLLSHPKNRNIHSTCCNTMAPLLFALFSVDPVHNLYLIYLNGILE